MGLGAEAGSGQGSAQPQFSPDRAGSPLPLGLWCGAHKVHFYNRKPVASKHSFTLQHVTAPS